MIFYNANDINLDSFCKIDTISETISSGRINFAIWGILLLFLEGELHID